MCIVEFEQCSQHHRCHRHRCRNSQSTTSSHKASEHACLVAGWCERRARVSSLSANKHDYVQRTIHMKREHYSTGKITFRHLIQFLSWKILLIPILGTINSVDVLNWKGEKMSANFVRVWRLAIWDRSQTRAATANASETVAIGNKGKFEIPSSTWKYIGIGQKKKIESSLSRYRKTYLFNWNFFRNHDSGTKKSKCNVLLSRYVFLSIGIRNICLPS